MNQMLILLVAGQDEKTISQFSEKLLFICTFIKIFSKSTYVIVFNPSRPDPGRRDRIKS